MSSTCKFCETQQSVVDKQTIADEDVANGKMTEGEYLKRCDIIKKLYQTLLERCECDKQVELEDDEIEVQAVFVTPSNTIELVGLPGDFINKTITKQVLVCCEVIDGNKKMVYGIDEYGEYLFSPLQHIYYDNNDNLFKQEIDWVLGHI